MSLAYDRNHVREFVPAADRELPPETRTVLLWSPLSVFDDFELADTHGTRGDQKKAWWYAHDVVERALRGWRNLSMPDGTPAPFEVDPATKRPTRATMERLGGLLIELFVAVRSAEGTTEGESKAS